MRKTLNASCAHFSYAHKPEPVVRLGCRPSDGFALVCTTPDPMDGMTHKTDQELMALIRQSDEAAFAELYHRFVNGLLNTAFQRLADKDLTEEVVQDLFVGLWLRREQTFIAGSVLAYLFTALRNRIIDLYRQESRRADYTDMTGPLLTANAGEESLFYHDLITAYERQLAQLPTKCQSVFILYKQGKSVGEIADLLTMAPKTVESHLLKANRTLRTRLKDYALLAVLLPLFA